MYIEGLEERIKILEHNVAGLIEQNVSLKYISLYVLGKKFEEKFDK